MNKIFIVAMFLSSPALAQTSPPLPGHLDSLERWMMTNKVDDATKNAMLACESHVTKPDSEPADPTYLKVYPFDPAWDVSCSALRSKMFAAAQATVAAKITADKALVDSLAARN